ncbi:MAG TPA: ABC-2 family transporter protein, partial [Anaerolineaceae bacterium]
MHTLRLLSAFFKVNIQMMLAYRVDTAVNVLLEILQLGWELVGLSIIFSNTKTLGGWSLGELIALLGVFHLVNALMNVLIWPNTEKFNASVRDGTLDYTLLQPADSMFLVTFSRMVIWRVWDLVLGATLIGIGIHMSGRGATPTQVAG